MQGTHWRWPSLALTLIVAACGGGKGDTTTADPGAQQLAKVQATHVTGDGNSLLTMGAAARLDATRLAQQASFGPTEALINEIKASGAAPWIAAQMALNVSRYTSGKGDDIHKNTSGASFCDLPQYASPTCWRDWYSTEPLEWDFFRNATSQPDQLRQRVALALQQVLVVSNNKVSGTYGFRLYYNNLLQGAFGNYRDVLRKVVLSPVMGEYLDHVNNDRDLPNENFARELLQLFSIGTCTLNVDGSLAGGNCQPTYDNDMVRNYAYALTGWTFPPGGATPYGCYPEGDNCEYMGGDMVAAPVTLHNTAARALLSNISLRSGNTAPQALESVLDSLMKHGNLAPFVGRRLIQSLVSSNPSPAYITRVAKAFNSGSYRNGGQTFGSGQKGDLAATVAAVLLDAEARSALTTGGYLRDPVLLFTGTLRALNGATDGAPLGWWWGESLNQHIFMPPSVFNFYPPDYPVAGTKLVGPQFGIHNVNTALERLNWLTYLLDWGGSAPDPGIPNAIGTQVNLQPFEALAGNPGQLVDNLSLIALGRKLDSAPRAKVITAVSWWNASTDAQNWKHERVATAAYLVFASPDYQVQR